MHGRGTSALSGLPKCEFCPDAASGNRRGSGSHVHPEARHRVVGCGGHRHADVRRWADSSAAKMSDDPPQEAVAALKADAKKTEGENDEEDEDEKEIENPPWYATALVRTLLAILAVLLLTACLLVFGKARISSREVEELEEQWEHTIDKAHIIDVPARCPQGQRFFRGKCRRVF